MELIYVYNANADPFSVIIDYAHKLLQPSTYKCDLCALTHNNLGQRKEWKKFVEASDAKMSFYHIKEFEAVYNAKSDDHQWEYPVILEKRDHQLHLVLDKDQLSKISSVGELIHLLNSHIKRI